MLFNKKISLVMRWPWKRPKKETQKVFAPAPPSSSERRLRPGDPIPVHERTK